MPSDLRCEDDDDKLGSDSFDERVFLGDDRSSILKLAPLPPLCDDGILLVHAELSKCNRQVQVYNFGSSCLIPMRLRLRDLRISRHIGIETILFCSSAGI